MVRFDAPFFGDSNLILGRHYQNSHENPDFYDFDKKRHFHDTTGRSYPIPVLTSPKQHWASDTADEHRTFHSVKSATNGNVQKQARSELNTPTGL